MDLSGALTWSTAARARYLAKAAQPFDLEDYAKVYAETAVEALPNEAKDTVEAAAEVGPNKMTLDKVKKVGKDFQIDIKKVKRKIKGTSKSLW